MVIEADMRPTLAAKVRLRKDRISGRYMLLYPERGMELNTSGAQIVQLCDGQATVAEIVLAMCQRYAATPNAVIEREVFSFLEALRQRALLA
jgi:coenzyme PQQ biosynthesis protein PqqD